MCRRHNGLLHEQSGDPDENAYDSDDNPAVPVVSYGLSLYPLLVDSAVAGHVVEDFVLLQVIASTVFVALCRVDGRRFVLLHAFKRAPAHLNLRTDNL